LHKGALSDRVVLRVARDGRLDEWWTDVLSAPGSVPWPIMFLATGHNRVELTRSDALVALEWASSVPGWDEAYAPVFLYDPAAPGPPGWSPG
jgi:hypothetical protein